MTKIFTSVEVGPMYLTGCVSCDAIFKSVFSCWLVCAMICACLAEVVPPWRVASCPRSCAAVELWAKSDIFCALQVVLSSPHRRSRFEKFAQISGCTLVRSSESVATTYVIVDAHSAIRRTTSLGNHDCKQRKLPVASCSAVGNALLSESFVLNS